MSSTNVVTQQPLPASAVKPNGIKAPGNIAVWVLIYAELFEFAFFFIIFLIAKAHNQDVFASGPSQLHTQAGMLNTLALLTSSFFIAQAIKKLQGDDRRGCLLFLYLTILCGLSYCGIKWWEYEWNQAQGITSRANAFFATYYYLTFNHWVHVGMGICVVLWTTVRVHLGHFNKENLDGLESAASYWHMIDLVWLMIFPLLYVLK